MGKLYIVRLSDEERKQLADILSKKHVAAQNRKRAQVLLKAESL